MNSEKIPPHCPPDDPCIWCREESLKARLEEVARERDEAREQLTDFLMLMLPRPAGEPSLVADTINVPLTGSPLVLRVIEAMVSVLKEGPGNFRAISFRSAKDGQEYSLTIQREGGKTPAQRITELEETAKILLYDLAESNEEMKRLRGVIADLRRKIGDD